MTSGYHTGQIRSYGPSSPRGILPDMLITQLQLKADPEPGPECWLGLDQD